MSRPAPVLPTRRPELIVDRGIVEDPRTGDFFTLGPQESFLLLGLDGRRTAGELTADFEHRFGQPLPSADLDDFVALARTNGLLWADTGPVEEIAAPADDDVRLPARRTDLVIRAADDAGKHVIKDPQSGEFFTLGPEESYLLLGLDGKRTAAALAADFTERFGEPLTADDVADFVELARTNRFVLPEGQAAEVPGPTGAPAPRPKPKGQSILYWRKSVFDPDRLFNWLEPRLRFLWTRTFLVLSALAVVAALLVAWENGRELVGQLPAALNWQTLALGWLTLVVVTTLHEFAHGLTCKHYGGEVHEIGFLLLFFTPCFFCNVSDAWLFKERARRLWVTFAGGYCDMVLWALGVFAWRVTPTDTLINQIAWVALTVCGGRVFFNFNPLIKLDGYYLVSDALDLPNLQQRGRDAVFDRLRWLLWGARRPEPEPRGRAMIVYGAVALTYGVVIVSVTLVALGGFAGARWGLIGYAWPALIGVVAARGLLSGLFKGELTRMLVSRRKRTLIWLALVGAGIAAIVTFEKERRATGTFLVRPVVRADVHAPVAGFLRDVPFVEGDRVSLGATVARLDIPDLDSKLIQKRTEVVELTAKLAQCRSQLEAAQEDAARSGRLARASALSQDEHRNNLKRCRDCASELEQTQARLDRTREEVNYMEVQQTKLLVPSPVPGLVVTPRLREHIGKHFKEGDLLCTVEEPSPLRVEIRLSEQEVRHVRSGQRVELKARALPFETFVGTVERVAPAAAAPAAPAAAALPVAPAGDTASSFVVYCTFDDGHAGLTSGMTGNARILCGRTSVGRLGAELVLRFIRTEFWW